MCGVFGAVSYGGEIDRSVLLSIARTAEQRGRHAHGLAWVDAAGRLRRYKAEGAIGRNDVWVDLVAGARAVIGHTRYATQGRWTDNENNHPHPSDGGWIVHNGVVRNYRSLVDGHDLFPSSDCDTEAIALLIEQHSGTLAERVRDAVSLVEGPTVVLGLWTRPLRVAVARAGNPLCISRADGVAYLCSLPAGLPGKPRQILDRTARVIVPKADRYEQTMLEIPEREPGPAGQLRMNF